MDRSLMFKYIFLLFVGLIVVVVFTYNFFGGKDDEGNFEDVFETEDSNEGTEFNLDDFNTDELIDNDDTVKKNDVDSELNGAEDEPIAYDKVEFEEYDSVYEEHDYGEKYIGKYGKSEYEKTLSLASKILPLYLEKDKEVFSFKENMTKVYYEKVKGDVGKGESPNVDSIDVFPTEYHRDNEIVIGGIVQMNDESHLYNLMFIKESGEFRLDEIVPMW